MGNRCIQGISAISKLNGPACSGRAATSRHWDELETMSATPNVTRCNTDNPTKQDLQKPSWGRVPIRSSSAGPFGFQVGPISGVAPPPSGISGPGCSRTIRHRRNPHHLPARRIGSISMAERQGNGDTTARTVADSRGNRMSSFLSMSDCCHFRQKAHHYPNPPSPSVALRHVESGADHQKVLCHCHDDMPAPDLAKGGTVTSIQDRNRSGMVHRQFLQHNPAFGEM